MTGAPTTIQSRQFRGFLVDEHQRIGTLTGLTNRLILRNESGSCRKAIIPSGKVSYQISGNHVSINIDNADVNHASYHMYDVDLRLGRLRATGGLNSKFFQYYLHAVTSHCLKDWNRRMPRWFGKRIVAVLLDTQGRGAKHSLKYRAIDTSS